MFSTTQRDFIEDFVQQQYKEGFIYYVAFTNTNLSSSSSYNFRDISIIVSKEPIHCSNNTFSSSNACIRYDIITRNASRDYTTNRIARSNLNFLNLTVNNYEFIESNAVNSNHMNFLALEEITYMRNLSYNLDLNSYYVIPVLLSVSILLTWLFSWFGRVRGKSV